MNHTEYDDLNRLKKFKSSPWVPGTRWGAQDEYKVSGITYDLFGNIKTVIELTEEKLNGCTMPTELS